jgi:regulator of sigma E protease
VLAVLSISLGIINLVPIPVLDGGQVLYQVLEWIKGSPLSERALASVNRSESCF